jgi:hypothetical protein
MTAHALRIEVLGQENGLLTLISGVLMTILAFWAAGQFFVEKAYGVAEGEVSSRVHAGPLVARQRKREPDEIDPSSRARSSASLRLCASSLEQMWSM